MNRRVGKRRACRKGNARSALSHKPSHGFTFIEPVPLTPATLAVIVTVPAARPFTWAVLPGATPRVAWAVSALVTIATLVSLLVHIVKTAVSVSPAASMGHALSDTVLSTLTLSVAGLTLTVATFVVSNTLTFEVALWPWIAAVTVVNPVATDFAMPFWPTVATLAEPVVQSTV